MSAGEKPGWGEIATFFLLTFAITWACWIPVAAAVPLASPLAQLLVYVGVFSPAITALLLTGTRRGAPGVRALLSRVWPVRVAWRWVVFALGYLAGVKLVAALLHRVVTGHWPRFDASALALIPFAIAVSTPVQAGEELGWRGFALPRLAARLGLAPASLLLGLVWATWHLPLFFVRGTDTFGQSFVLYAVQVMAIAAAIAMLYVRTHAGLFLPMLFHAAVNNTKDIVPSATPGAHAVFSPAASLLSWLAAGVLWACTLFILGWMVRTEADRRARYPDWIAPAG
ncbi:MAG TPA: CPBP family intramembrane glutamic endopeptidase [Methylomirabilota bacterium]|nr:CPBP family intramembrane glutamic endopeptidase [Methylomirabilota bacterium]